MPEPTAALQALRASTADLLKGLDEEHWSDADVAAPSLCAGWTRGHVLTHLARNADSITATLSGALRGEVVERYPGGPAARDAAIAEGAARPVAALVADVTETADRLDRVLAAIADADRWDEMTADDRTAHTWVEGRLTEVEIHRVDLAGRYGPDRWPPLLVSSLLPCLIETLPKRADDALTVVVQVEQSVVPELSGTLWSGGTGEPTEVAGPDWAVLAWLTGRGAAVAEALTAPPALRAWD